MKMVKFQLTAAKIPPNKIRELEKLLRDVLITVIKRRKDISSIEDIVTAYKASKDIKDPIKAAMWDLFWLIPGEKRIAWMDSISDVGFNDSNIETILKQFYKKLLNSEV